MQNPTYASGDYKSEPRPERIQTLSMLHTDQPQAMLSVGVKVITHSRDGLKLIPHEVIAVEIREDDEVASFDIPPSMATAFGERMIELAAAVKKPGT